MIRFIKRVLCAASCAAGVHEWHYPDAKGRMVKGQIYIRDYGSIRVCLTCGEEQVITKELNQQLLAGHTKHLTKNLE